MKNERRTLEVDLQPLAEGYETIEIDEQLLDELLIEEIPYISYLPETITIH